MAHELAMSSNGRASMFYTGAAPWHRLGTRLENPATAAEAIAAAGLDYEVVSLPMFAQGDGPDAPCVPVPGHVLNVRADTMTPLGVVSDKYRVINNRDCFGFLDAVVREGELKYHTAGALGKGERVWMLARLPEVIRVAGSDDVTEQYLLLSNSHDASSALRVVFTPVRVVCQNTLSAALSSASSKGVTVHHTGDLDRKVEEARKVLGLASRWFGAFGEGAELLAGHRPTELQLKSYFAALYPDPEGGDPAKAKATRMTLFGLYEMGMGQDIPQIRGTTWAAYNAVTEYLDHHVGRDPQRRLESAWWGDGARAKARAYDLAVRLAHAGTAPLLGLE